MPAKRLGMYQVHGPILETMMRTMDSGLAAAFGSGHIIQLGWLNASQACLRRRRQSHYASSLPTTERPPPVSLRDATDSAYEAPFSCRTEDLPVPGNLWALGTAGHRCLDDVVAGPAKASSTDATSHNNQTGVEGKRSNPPLPVPLDQLIMTQRLFGEFQLLAFDGPGWRKPNWRWWSWLQRRLQLQPHPRERISQRIFSPNDQLGQLSVHLLRPLGAGSSESGAAGPQSPHGGRFTGIAWIWRPRSGVTLPDESDLRTGTSQTGARKSVPEAPVYNRGRRSLGQGGLLAKSEQATEASSSNRLRRRRRSTRQVYSSSGAESGQTSSGLVQCGLETGRHEDWRLVCWVEARGHYSKPEDLGGGGRYYRTYSVGDHFQTEDGSMLLHLNRFDHSTNPYFDWLFSF
ncbi:unnamed protein product [Protopolystoma xenopodis]|uniref:Uncharacterized protein n=1 Tax=Protopolystoma xenopodis TaxID=117903 RepID=A0A3S5C4N3_9PLAT|nr:unnamed protein product [Protopolystoma xenopodis]